MDPKGRLSSEIHFLVPLGITYSDALHCGNTLDQIYQIFLTSMNVNVDFSYCSSILK